MANRRSYQSKVANHEAIRFWNCRVFISSNASPAVASIGLSTFGNMAQAQLARWSIFHAPNKASTRLLLVVRKDGKLGRKVRKDGKLGRKVRELWQVGAYFERQSSMKFISLFSGIGGFDLAFERAGMECVAVCEIDKNAQSVLRRHFPKAELFDDVRKVGKETHGRKTIDLVCGGFPCQDVSIAGRRAGLAGERSGLWFEFARIIDEIEPRWVVIENVPGLLSSNKGQDFAVIVQWLAERGYGVAWRVLDAQFFGVPQRRRRVFIVASFGNGSATEVLFESEGGERDNTKIRSEGKTIATTFTIRSGKDGGGKGYLGFDDGAMTLGGQPQYLFDRQRSDEYGEGSENVSTLSARDYKSATDLILWEPRLQDGTPRIHESGIVPTLNTAQGGQRQSMVGVRRLMPIECERLQGFPDGWTDGQSDSARYRQLGNAVAVPVVEWIGRRIVKAETPSNNRLHSDAAPAQQALFTPEADTAEGKLPAKSRR